ncbi:MAG: hypothetical protein LUC95_00810 [Lachnospiraceae bacterium]|nr:hypothetical protein [Lachnospiraceae bacterium]
MIVEGEHEKNKLFWLLFKIFPEMNIHMDNIWIYGTNIYQLYGDIVNEYGADWAEEEVSVNLPLIVSRRNSMLDWRETKFTNILLVFDYEKQDPFFSEKKILDMQKAFSDRTDMGQLYINYPMVESYMYLKALPDYDYLEYKTAASLKSGSEYKRDVNKESGIKYTLDFPQKLYASLTNSIKTTDSDLCGKYCEEVCNISDAFEIENKLQSILGDAIVQDRLETLLHDLPKRIHNAGFAYNGESYWEYARDMFKQIIYHNIWKANYIQNNQNVIDERQYKSCFEQLDLTKILQIQNISSRDISTGFIWVLNTCVLIVAEYNFKLVL